MFALVLAAAHMLVLPRESSFTSMFLHPGRQEELTA